MGILGRCVCLLTGRCGLSSSNVMERICWGRPSMLLSSEDVVEMDCGVPFAGLGLTPRGLGLLRRLVGDEKIFLKPSMLSYRIAFYGMLRVRSCWVSLVFRSHLYLSREVIFALWRPECLPHYVLVPMVVDRIAMHTIMNHEQASALQHVPGQHITSLLKNIHIHGRHRS
jgi:hypothetical protein